MGRKYSEDELPWSVIEKYVPYATVQWPIINKGIPMYRLLDRNGKKIDINDYIGDVFG